MLIQSELELQWLVARLWDLEDLGLNPRSTTSYFQALQFGFVILVDGILCCIETDSILATELDAG